MKKQTINLIIVISVIVAVVIASIVVAVVMTKKDSTKPVPEVIETVTTDDGTFTYKTSQDQVTLTKFENGAGKREIKVPDTFNDVKVTCIGDSAFAKDMVIEKVVLGANVQTIGKSAFEGCTNLTNVKATNLVTIDAKAFADCRRLTYFDIPATLTTIGERAFANTNALRNIQYEFDDKANVKSNLSSIGEYAFENSAISRIIIPSTLKVIGPHAFASAKSVGEIIFYDGVESIENEAFLDAGRYGEIRTYDANRKIESQDNEVLLEMTEKNKWPSTLKYIGSRAFARSDSDSGSMRLFNMTLPASLVSVGDEAFLGCYIESLSFMNPDTTLGKYAFSKVTYNGIRVTLPANLTVINEGLFYGSRLSDTIKIPANVETIGIGAFSGSNYRYNIDLQGSKADANYMFKAEGGFSGLLSKDGKVVYSVLSPGEVTLPRSVEVIEKYAFSKPKSSDTAVRITIGSHVKTIKAGAFADSNIYDITLEHGVGESITIDDDAFTPIDFVGDKMRNFAIRVNGEAEIFEALKSQFASSENVTIFEKAE